MNKRIISLLSLVLTLCILLGSMVSCELPTDGNTDNNGNDTTGGNGGTDDGTDSAVHVDYVADTKLDMNSSSLKQEVTVKYYIDGDTTHFYVPKTMASDGIFKARYLGVDTPESTGVIEEWGKLASSFTKDKLFNAHKIIIESDDDKWNYDGNGRALLWIWYQPTEGADFRNLNLELVQNGLGLASSDFESTYATPIWSAYEQAMAEELYIHSNNIDPDYPYDEAMSITLKELCLNTEAYMGKNIVVEGVSTFNADNTSYIEQFDAETGRYFAMKVFYGYNSTLVNLFKAGNMLRVVGTVTEFYGTYQINNIQYDIMSPDDPANSTLISSGNEIAYPEATGEEWDSSVVIDGTTYTYQEIANSRSISMKGLTINDIYTTTNTASDDCGAMTLYCELDGVAVQVRTTVLKDRNGVIDDAYKDSEGRITELYFSECDTIDIKGIVEYYDYSGSGNGVYQIKVFSINNIVLN